MSAALPTVLRWWRNSGACVPAETCPSRTQTLIPLCSSSSWTKEAESLASWSCPVQTPGRGDLQRARGLSCPCQQVRVNFCQDREWTFTPCPLRLEGHPLPRARSPFCSYKHLSSKCLSSCCGLCGQAEHPPGTLSTKPPGLHKETWDLLRDSVPSTLLM